LSGAGLSAYQKQRVRFLLSEYRLLVPKFEKHI
jgi:hypothetical protein